MSDITLDFSREEYQERIAKTRIAMESYGVDLLIVTDPSNMAWLTGYDGWSFYVHQAVLLALDGEPIWFGRGQDAPGAKRTVFMDHANVIDYPDHYVQSTERHPMDFLCDLLKQRAFGKATIDFAKKIDPLWAQFTITVPYPGTPMFIELERKGQIRTYDWSRYNMDRGIDWFTFLQT